MLFHFYFFASRWTDSFLLGLYASVHPDIISTSWFQLYHHTCPSLPSSEAYSWDSCFSFGYRIRWINSKISKIFPLITYTFITCKPQFSNHFFLSCISWVKSGRHFRNLFSFISSCFFGCRSVNSPKKWVTQNFFSVLREREKVCKEI